MAKKQIEVNTSKKGSFLSGFNKDCAKMEGVSLSAPPPKYWLDTGAYAINKVMSGSYNRGWASGRQSAVAGPSGSGKSYLLGNAVRAALNCTDVEWGVLIIDSEHAIDEDYLKKIGAKVEGNPLYNYRGVTKITQAVNIISKFTTAYRAANEDMPFLIAIDSLDMMQTDTENEQYLDGEIKGDMGQHARQIKAMLKRFTNDIKELDIVMLHTKQAYVQQDKILAYNNPYIITESSKFAFSQIAMINKFMLKDDDTKKFEGINLKVRGEKTRFAKPFQQVAVEVPYDTGMDPYSGILEAAVSLGIVERVTKQSYEFENQTFTKNKFDNYKEAIFAKLLERDSENLDVPIEGEDDLTGAMNGKEIQLLRKTRGGDSTQTVEE